jgi:hypothetical protein
MKSWILKWLFGEAANRVQSAGLSYPEDTDRERPHVRIGVMQVMNGKLLEVTTYKRNPHGPDWNTTYWVMNEEQTLAEQISTVMVMKGLDK